MLRSVQQIAEKLDFKVDMAEVSHDMVTLSDFCVPVRRWVLQGSRGILQLWNVVGLAIYCIIEADWYDLRWPGDP